MGMAWRNEEHYECMDLQSTMRHHCSYVGDKLCIKTIF